MAQGMQVKVKNGTNYTILQGKAVYIIDFDSVDFVIIVGVASYTNQDTLPSIGVALEDIDPGGIGAIKISGIASGPNTLRASPGQDVFVGSNGDLVFYDPLSSGGDYKSQRVGVVLTSEEIGQIFLFPMELNKSVRHPELEDIEPDDHHDEDHAERHSDNGDDPLTSQDITVNRLAVTTNIVAGNDIEAGRNLSVGADINFSDTTTQSTSANNLYIASNPSHSQSSGLTRYYAINGNLDIGAESDQEQYFQIKMNGSGILNKLRAICYTYTGAYTVIKIRKNGSDTSLSITLTTTGAVENSSDEVSYVNGDLINYSIVTSGTGSVGISLIQVNNTLS